MYLMHLAWGLVHEKGLVQGDAGVFTATVPLCDEHACLTGSLPISGVPVGLTITCSQMQAPLNIHS